MLVTLRYLSQACDRHAACLVTNMLWRQYRHQHLILIRKNIFKMNCYKRLHVIKWHSMMTTFGRKSVKYCISQTKIHFTIFHITGGILYKLKKSSKEDFSRDGICMRFCISSKFEPFSFLLNSCSKIDFCLKFNFSSNFELIQNFRTKKSELIQNFDTWSIFEQEFNKKLNGSNFELIQNLMHIPSLEKILLRWLFELIQDTPRISVLPKSWVSKN